jgi:hypothetical protein
MTQEIAMKTLDKPAELVPAKGPGFDNMDWYLANVDRLIEEYKGQRLAIHNCQVIAASYDSRELAQKVRAMGLTRVLLASSSRDAMQPYK